MIDVFKLGAASVCGAIAALTAIVAGLLSDARLQIILGRAFCSFIVSGLVVYIAIFLFDRLGYASIIHEFEENWKNGEKEEEQAVGDKQETEENSEDSGEAGEETPQEESDSSEEGGFTPLQADELRHVATDQEE
ncbi:hypothetical protein SAMN02745671_00272 [Anaerovibrio lipolyticus DSM 3074]|uniref:Uncharacterized protein n=2 Tax=Anaerovibrio lipolyticus TaxID=82374 RepID=A0A0B2JX94_9FIRM|nr:hypothetical protein [Anaerovibrio lipolyticus]KHM52219.1 hypothetical protein NZ47_06010 [Anaerovibrio lipolyticus]SHI34115.1 hypothetical protein SAMN02745671_00272 [Anaerovibrio lipolyticus DSM 3074]